MIVNTILLIGNLGADPELKNAGSSVVTTFSVATSESWKDKSSGEKKQSTDWHNCVAWGATAEFICKYAKKGNKVCVQGSMHYSTYENKDGVSVKKPEMKLSRYNGFQILVNNETKGEDDGFDKLKNVLDKSTSKLDKFDENIPF